MKLETVDSAAIHAFGYNADTRLLEIIFNEGGIYYYSDVPSVVYRRMTRSTSPGRFFHENIRGRYPYRRLGRRNRAEQPALSGS